LRSILDLPIIRFYAVREALDLDRDLTGALRPCN
jgi:hypothetical protein